MLSKNQFCLLVEGLNKQYKFEQQFDKAVGMVNKSWTTCELAEDLCKDVFDVIYEDFNGSVVDLICEFVYQEKRDFVFYIDGNEKETKYHCDTYGEFYDMCKEVWLLD